MTVNENGPWMTAIMCVLALLFTIVGGVVTFVQPDTLSFDQYLERTGQLALAVAALGVGRSLKKGLARSAGADVDGGLLERAPVTTITIAAIVVIVAVTGGVLTIVDPSRLPFDTYLQRLNTFAFAVGLQGAGRALRKGVEKRGEAQAATAVAAAPPALGAAGFADHPDSPLNPASIVPEPIPEAPGFVDPSDVSAADDELGADQEPIAGAPLDGGPPDGDLDESGLPSDEEEEAFQPPEEPEISIFDVYVLDAEGAAQPGVVMPSQHDQELQKGAAT